MDELIIIEGWSFIVRDLDVDKKIVSCNIFSSSLEKYAEL